MSNASKQPEPTPGQAPTPSNADICAYIAEICGELRGLAQRPRFRTLGYLLDMARLEAERMGKEIRNLQAGDQSGGGGTQTGESH